MLRPLCLVEAAKAFLLWNSGHVGLLEQVYRRIERGVFPIPHALPNPSLRLLRFRVIQPEPLCA